MSGTKDNLNFNGFGGYYNNLYHSSYGGFDWLNMMEINKSMIDNILGYCDTGYNNVLHGRGEGVAVLGDSFMYTYAQTFNLKSGVFASAWSTNQPVYIYGWANGSETGEIKVNLSQNATRIDFAKYGNEFKNLNELEIRVMSKGEAGNTCTYGKPTYGYQVAFDNLKITLNAPSAHHGGQGNHIFQPRVAQHHIGGPFGAMLNIGASGHAALAAISSHDTGSVAGAGYHSELASLNGAGPHEHASLTSQFALPQVEHFGA
jgi:hypothetical protein